MSFVHEFCNNCGTIEERAVICKACKCVSYCSIDCKFRDYICHQQYCRYYIRRSDIRAEALAEANKDINTMFSHKQFGDFIRALYENWDPFHTAHICCSIAKGEYVIRDNMNGEHISAPYITCSVKLVPGLTTADKTIRLINVQYTYYGVSPTIPIRYRTNVRFSAQYGTISYNKICGNKLMDIQPCSQVKINLMTQTGACVLSVDGTLWRLA